MVVLIMNLTDAPACKHPPTQVDIYNKTLDPGGTLKIPADLVDKKIRSLEEMGIISIGQIPSWYTTSKAARRGRSLSAAEKASRIAPKKVTPEPKMSLHPKKNGLAVVEKAPVGEELILDHVRR